MTRRLLRFDCPSEAGNTFHVLQQPNKHFQNVRTSSRVSCDYLYAWRTTLTYANYNRQQGKFKNVGKIARHLTRMDDGRFSKHRLHCTHKESWFVVTVDCILLLYPLYNTSFCLESLSENVCCLGSINPSVLLLSSMVEATDLYTYCLNKLCRIMGPKIYLTVWAPEFVFQYGPLSW